MIELLLIIYIIKHYNYLKIVSNIYIYIYINDYINNYIVLDTKYMRLSIIRLMLRIFELCLLICGQLNNYTFKLDIVILSISNLNYILGTLPFYLCKPTLI